MSATQVDLGEFNIGISYNESISGGQRYERNPLLGFRSLPDAPTLTDDIAAARNVDWVIYTGRYPHVFDAARLGFGIGHREDNPYQWTPSEVRLPVHFLDNDYRDADLDRFIERVQRYKPEIAVLGDIYDIGSLDEHLEAAEKIWNEYPSIELILVPKCKEVLEEIPEDFILGFPNGNSEIQALDIATYEEWRNLPHRLHILGGTPLSTYDCIVNLTRRSITDTPPANIAGLDWNGYQLYAEQFGKYAAVEGGWNRNLADQYIPKRDLIRYSLLNAKHFWVSKSIWPGATVEDLQKRETLLKANNGGPVDIETTSDARELLLSPPPNSNRHSDPLYRTDKTQTEIMEPLSPAASLFRRLSWTPAGTLSGRVSYSPPKAHFSEATCTGCGAHILSEPEACVSPLDELPKRITLQLVSYEHEHREETHDYESVSRDGPRKLETDVLFPAIHCFCSDGCRKRTEYRTPDLLFDSDVSRPSGWPEPSTICNIEISVPQ